MSLRANIMVTNRLMMGLIVLSVCAALHAQECRDPNPKEISLYKQSMQVFDETVLAKCRNEDWDASLKFDGGSFTVVNQKMLPERPFSFCGFERFEIGMSRKPGTEMSNLIQDSLKYYQDADTKLSGDIYTQLSNAKAEEVAAVQKRLAPSQAKLHTVRYRSAQLSSRIGMNITTNINSPLLILSSPSGGELASTCKKIHVPGASLAYLITLHDDDMGDKYKVVLGLGKWVDNLKGYELGSDLYIYYHFTNHYPSDVIESIVVTISGGSAEDVMKLVNSIDWTRLGALLK